MIITSICILLVLLCSCNSSGTIEYYSQKENYISVTGTVSDIKYNEDTTALYIDLSELSPALDDTCFKIKKCVYDDIVEEIKPKFEECDGLVIGSPVYYAGPAGQLCAFLDRLFYISKGRMAGKIGASVVSCRRGGATAAFDRLNKYFGISNMHIAGSQYWNQIHGNTPEEAMQDPEGLQTMRTLAQNMVWLLKCKEAGIEMPEYEKKVATNFIR